MDTNYERLLTRKEASDFLTQRGYQTAVATLAKLAVIGGGPAFERFGRLALYNPADLLAWVSEKCASKRKRH